MKRTTAVTRCMALAVSAALFAGAQAFAESSRAGLPSAAMPEIIQKVGEADDIVLGPVKYPLFKEAKPSSDTAGHNKCAAELLKIYDPQTKEGLSLAPVPGAKTGFILIPDLTLNVTIPKKNLETTKVLINWTLRVEGVRPDEFDTKCSAGCKKVTDDCKCGSETAEQQEKQLGAYCPWPCLCDSWHGSTVQIFKGGQINSRLKVNRKEVGNIASMTMPDGGAITATQVYDPTISGSCLLTKNDFPDGKFPSTLNIEVEWENNTSLKLISPKKTHMVVVSVMPITASN
ncbi:MAG: hypothetical protein PHT59_07095 [Candidatus Omnitrophica bacterium]|nr:hypothetical protein [Candidatus Omnitrophota bacterium]